VFTHIDAGLEGMQRSTASWGDYDRDGDLDILLTGNGVSSTVARLYRNNAPNPNTVPSAPGGLGVSVVLGGAATFSWNPAIDAQTASAGLTYNLRVGTTPGGSEVSASMAAGDGVRRIVQLGNTNHRTSWAIPLASIPLTSRIYFSVQAIDHTFAGSPFSDERAFGAMQTILSINDVGNDQGRQARIRWERSFLDAPGASPAVTGYAIWRRVDAFKAAVDNKDSRPSPVRSALPPGEWDYVLTVPARANDTYSVVVPTLCDSTIAGACFSTFFVSGMTTNPATYFDSAPDSGYSIDNLSPAIPQGLTASLASPSQVALAWSLVTDPDLNFYVVYRGTTAGFTPNAANRVGYATSPDFEDTHLGAGTYYYKLTAVDFAGNESAPSGEGAVTVTPTDGPPPSLRNALHAAQPNPFNPTTTIRFDLESSGQVTLMIFDARGVRVRTLIQQHMPAGTHSLAWNGDDDRGRVVRSGSYFCQLTAAGFSARSKLTLVR